jgi:DNA-binding beta-propeller fold protein YncE
MATACARKKVVGYPGYALVTTGGENSLTVVDLLSFQVSKVVELGASPTAVVSSADGTRNYVLTPGNGTIHFFNGQLGKVAAQQVADSLSEIFPRPGGKSLLALATGRQNQLVEVDAESLAVLRRHDIAATPVSLDVSSTGYAAVSTGKAGGVELINLATGERTRRQLSGEIGTVRFRSDGRMLLVASYHDRSLTALDLPALRTVADLPLAMMPENLCFSADNGGQLFISGAEMDGVAIVFPYQIMEVEQTVLAGRTPGVMACSSTPPYLFVASRDVSNISVLSVDTRKTIGVVEVGRKPGFVAITPDSRFALVLDEQSGDMAVIHIPSITSHKLTPGMALSTRVGPLFTMVPVGSEPVSASIIPRVA